MTSTRSSICSSVDAIVPGTKTPSIKKDALGEPRIFDMPLTTGRSESRPNEFTKEKPGVNAAISSGENMR